MATKMKATIPVRTAALEHEAAVVEEEVPRKALQVNMAMKTKARAMRTAVIEDAVPKQSHVTGEKSLNMRGKNSLNTAMKMKALNRTSSNLRPPRPHSQPRTSRRGLIR